MSHDLQRAELARRAIDACWSRIGVSGDRSCPELKVHIHCRNCPVYSSAARALLDAPPPHDALEQSTRHFANPTALIERSSNKDAAHSAIVFRLRSEWFALPTVLCLEVTDVRPIHSLPHRRSGSILGVANIRGELLVCISLTDILGLATQAESKQVRRGTVTPRLLVARREQGAVVFPVDEVQGVQRFYERDLAPTPATVAKAQAKYTKALLAVEQKTVGLIDDQLLFYTVERSLA